MHFSRKLEMKINNCSSEIYLFLTQFRHVLKIHLLEWNLKRWLKLACSFQWLVNFYALIPELMELRQGIFSYSFCLGKVPQSYINIITEGFRFCHGVIDTKKKEKRNLKPEEINEINTSRKKKLFNLLISMLNNPNSWNRTNCIDFLLHLLKNLIKYIKKQQ